MMAPPSKKLKREHGGATTPEPLAVRLDDMPNEILFHIVMTVFCYYPPQRRTVALFNDPSPLYRNRPETESEFPYCQTHVLIAAGVCRRWRHMVIDELERKNLWSVGRGFDSPFVIIAEPRPESIALESAFYGYETFIERVLSGRGRREGMRLHRYDWATTVFGMTEFYINISLGGHLDMLKRIYAKYRPKTDEDVEFAVEYAIVRTGDVQLLEWAAGADVGIIYPLRKASPLSLVRDDSLFSLAMEAECRNVDIAKWCVKYDEMKWCAERKIRENVRPVAECKTLSQMICFGNVDLVRFYIETICRMNANDCKGKIDILLDRTQAKAPTECTRYLENAVKSGSLPMVKYIEEIYGLDGGDEHKSASSSSYEARMSRIQQGSMYKAVVHVAIAAMSLRDIELYPYDIAEHLLGRTDEARAFAGSMMIAAMRMGSVEKLKHVIHDIFPHAKSQSCKDSNLYTLKPSGELVVGDGLSLVLWKHAIRSGSIDILNAATKIPHLLPIHNTNQVTRMMDCPCSNPSAYSHTYTADALPPITPAIVDWLVENNTQHIWTNQSTGFICSLTDENILRHAIHIFAWRDEIAHISSRYYGKYKDYVDKDTAIIAIVKGQINLLELITSTKRGRSLIADAVSFMKKGREPHIPTTIKTRNWLEAHGYKLAEYMALWHDEGNLPEVHAKWYADYIERSARKYLSPLATKDHDHDHADDDSGAV